MIPLFPQMTLPGYVERACDIAYERHGHQTRRDGVTLYIEHVQRVALMMRARGNDIAEAVAWLHDVVEDTGAIDWANERFPAPVEVAVVALTRKDGEAYGDYIERVARNPRARLVKLADIFDNLADTPTLGQKLKYLRALEILIAPSLEQEGNEAR